MIRILLVLFFGVKLVFAEVSVDSYLTASTSYINARGLNLITEGFNNTYSTEFSNINYLFGASASLRFNYGLSRISLEFSYFVRGLSSESSSYSFEENIDYNAVFIGLGFEYALYRYDRFSVAPVVKMGVALSFLELRTEPLPTGEVSEQLFALNIYGELGVSFYYDLTSDVSIFAQVLGRYSTSSAYEYRQTNDTTAKNVVLSTGQSVTMNVSGASFLLGVRLNIWR